MATAVKAPFGPADHGRPLTLDEFLAAEYTEGYKYELIDGKLYVSPAANQPENWVQEWVHFKLKLYAHDHPDVLNHVTAGARVFVPGRPRKTVPEPDIACYRDFPLHRRIQEVRWQDVSPVLVVEVLSPEHPEKDLVRNAGLYLLVPSIKEYWVLDSGGDAESPRLHVFRRHGKGWRRLTIDPGETYTTRLLPVFALTLNART